MKPTPDYFENVHMLATMLAVNGKSAARRRLIEILELPITDQAKHDMLCYELGLIAESLSERDPLLGRCRTLACR